MFQNKSKIITVLFSLVIIFLLFGCGTNSDSLLSNDSDIDIEETEDATNDILKESEDEIQPELVEDTQEQMEVSEESSAESEEEVNNKEDESSSAKNTTTSESGTNSSSNSSSNSSTSSSNTSTDKTTKKEETKKETEKPKEPPKKEEKKDDPPPPPAPKPEPSVTLSVIGPKGVGTIIGETKVVIQDGDTVLDVLLKEASKRGIHVDYRGRGTTAYVEGIDNVYEFDFGPKSGWVGNLNGAGLTKSSGSTAVKAGDRVQWIYTEDFTE